MWFCNATLNYLTNKQQTKKRLRFTRLRTAITKNCIKQLIDNVKYSMNFQNYARHPSQDLLDKPLLLLMPRRYANVRMFIFSSINKQISLTRVSCLKNIREATITRYYKQVLKFYLFLKFVYFFNILQLPGEAASFWKTAMKKEPPFWSWGIILIQRSKGKSEISVSVVRRFSTCRNPFSEFLMSLYSRPIASSVCVLPEGNILEATPPLRASGTSRKE